MTLCAAQHRLHLISYATASVFCLATLLKSRLLEQVANSVATQLLFEKQDVAAIVKYPLRDRFAETMRFLGTAFCYSLTHADLAKPVFEQRSTLVSYARFTFDQRLPQFMNKVARHHW